MSDDEREKVQELFWKAKLETEGMSLEELEKHKADSERVYQRAMEALAMFDAELKRRLSPADFQDRKDEADRKEKAQDAELARLNEVAKLVAPKPDSEM